MSTITTLNDVKYAAFIAEVADHAADAEVTTLFDYYGVGTLVANHGRERDAVKSDLIAAYHARNVKATTVNTYLSQGILLASTFATWNALETFADDNVKGSRSLKAIYTAVKALDKSSDVADGEGEGDDVAEMAATALVDVILANLAHLTDAGEIARVRDAAAAMLTVPAAA